MDAQEKELHVDTRNCLEKEVNVQKCILSVAGLEYTPHHGEADILQNPRTG